MTTYHNAIELCADSDGNFAEFGRRLYKYTDCGPWCRLLLTENRTCYYEDECARDPSTLTDPDIIGIEIGSIVEGSEVEVGPIFLRFPFTDDQLWATVEEINEEADFYWKRDNEDTFILTSGDDEFFVDAGWGNDFSGDTPDDIADKFAAWQKTDARLDEGESVEFDGLTIKRIDKSDMIF